MSIGFASNAVLRPVPFHPHSHRRKVVRKPYLFLYPLAVFAGVLGAILILVHINMPSEGYAITILPEVLERAYSWMFLLSGVTALFAGANALGRLHADKGMGKSSMAHTPMRLGIAGVAFMVLGLACLIIGEKESGSAIVQASICLGITIILYTIAHFIHGMISGKGEKT